MNTQSNIYTVVYSAIMVVVVAAALTLVSVGLKDRQDANEANAKRGNILKAAGIVSNDIAADYEKYVKSSFIVDSLGNKTNDDGFNTPAVYKTVVNNGKVESEIKLPVFELNTGSEKLYVLPLAGKGLWDKISGYVALKDDFCTISGIVFEHKGETPGLGAEMTKDFFCNQFKGRKMFEGNNFVDLKVFKGDPKLNECQDKIHGIDAITGSTFTTNGVQEMVNNCLKVYAPFKSKLVQPTVATNATQEEVSNNVNE